MTKALSKILSLLLTGVLIITINTCAASADNQIQVKLDNEYLTFDVPPQMVDNKVLVPIRKIFESMNMNISWEPETKTIMANKDQNFIVLQINNPNAFMNNEKFEMEIAPIIVNDRTMVPISLIEKSSGANVEWDPSTRTVIIETN